MLIYELTHEQRDRMLALLGELDDKVRRAEGWGSLSYDQRIVASILIDGVIHTLLSAQERYEDDLF